MKKTILFMAFAAVCGVGQAKILRVNNTTGSGAPYTTIGTGAIDGGRTSRTRT